MLTKDQAKRITLDKAQNHAWLKKFDSVEDDSMRELNEGFMRRLKNYRAPKRLQFQVLHFLINNTRNEEREKIKTAFRTIDRDKSGMISVEDIMDAFKKAGIEGVNERIQKIMDDLDFDKDGKINYSDFLTAIMDKREMITKENLRFAFHHFDSDHDGFITSENLYECFHRQGKGITQEDVDKMLEDAGIERTSKMAFEQFETLMMNIDEENPNLVQD